MGVVRERVGDFMAPYRRICPSWQLQRAANARIRDTMTEPTKRATTRPASFTPPAHWTNQPLPEPRAAEPGKDPDGIDPTRYGDWERNGIAIDF